MEEDKNFKELVVEPVDVSTTLNMKEGIAGFWFKAMINHPSIG
jgi:hypothetical protein